MCFSEEFYLQWLVLTSCSSFTVIVATVPSHGKLTFSNICSVLRPPYITTKLAPTLLELWVISFIWANLYSARIFPTFLLPNLCTWLSFLHEIVVAFLLVPPARKVEFRMKGGVGWLLEKGLTFAFLIQRNGWKKLLSSPCEIRHIEVSAVQILLWMGWSIVYHF